MAVIARVVRVERGVAPAIGSLRGSRVPTAGSLSAHDVIVIALGVGGATDRAGMRDGGGLIASIVAVMVVVITLGFLVWWMFIKR